MPRGLGGDTLARDWQLDLNFRASCQSSRPGGRTPEADRDTSHDAVDVSHDSRVFMDIDGWTYEDGWASGWPLDGWYVLLSFHYLFSRLYCCLHSPYPCY